MPTTSMEIITTIITTSIETDFFTEAIKENYVNNKKCKESTYESAKYNICSSCNEEEQYFPGFFLTMIFLHGFNECYNINTKTTNFYYDNSTKRFKPCYETCIA